MSLTTEVIDTLRNLSALEARTEDVKQAQGPIENKLDDLIDRLCRIEARYEHLREHLKAEVASDVKADLARVQVYLDLQSRGLLKNDTRRDRTVKVPSH
jgi:predicted nuclease with TOPRIM domain